MFWKCFLINKLLKPVTWPFFFFFIKQNSFTDCLNEMMCLEHVYILENLKLKRSYDVCNFLYFSIMRFIYYYYHWYLFSTVLFSFCLSHSPHPLVHADYFFWPNFIAPLIILAILLYINIFCITPSLFQSIHWLTAISYWKNSSCMIIGVKQCWAWSISGWVTI